MSMLLRYIVFLHSEHLNSLDPCDRRWLDEEAASSSGLGSTSLGLHTEKKIFNSFGCDDVSSHTILVL